MARLARATLLRAGWGAALWPALRRPALGQSTAKLRVAGVPLDNAAGVYYALEQGFFKKHGLDVEIVSLANGAATAAAVAGHALEIGNGNTISFATAHERGIPFLLVAPSGAYNSKTPTGALVVRRDSPVRGARDLVGKTVAVPSLRGVGELAVWGWLEKNGVAKDQASFVELGYPQMGPGLEAGRIDAAMPEEPALSNLLAGDVRILATAYDSIGPLWIEGGYFAISDYIAANPDVIIRFADAIAETDAWANANPDATMAILTKYAKTPVPPAMRRATFPERLVAAELQPLIDAAAHFGILQSAIPARALFAPGVRSA